MTDEQMLDRIGKYGYGVYRVADKIVIADPADGADGFYLIMDSVKGAYQEFVDSVLAHSA